MAADPRLADGRLSTEHVPSSRPSQPLMSKDAARPNVGRGLGSRLREIAVHDWVVLGLMMALLLGVLSAPASAARDESLARVLALFTIAVASVVVIRFQLLRHSFAAPLLYRFGLFGSMQLSYFILADLLPVVNTTTLDQELFELDLMLFGFEPALALQNIVTPTTSEWFAFFYYSYFFILAIHVIPILFFCRRRHIVAEFALGMMLLVSVTHTLYMIVPGYGPVKHFEWAEPLPSGLFHDLVMSAVSSSGAQKDIFPSLHTAAPTFIALFSFRHRDELPFRYSWPIIAFFALNIIIATMFMRWHWAIDVIAGLLLCFTVSEVSHRVSTWELESRRLAGRGELWPRFFEPVSTSTDEVRDRVSTPAE